jgi:hypothetical protein
MKDIVSNGIYNYTIFATSDKYYEAIWTNSHVIMANHICDLKLLRK